MGINFNDITFFKTAQGSKYIRLPDGRLRRWKSSHANTGGEDMGLHSWSTQSIFVDPKYEYPANSIQYLVGKGYKVALSKDAEGKMFPMIVDNGQWRPATWGDAYTVYARQNPDMANKVLSWKYSKEPVVGYHVVDFDLKGGGRGTEIKGYHFGSPVSEIGSLSDEDMKLFFPSQSNLQESIKRVLKELYSPEGRTVKPKKIVIHKSEKKNRKSIEQNGLIPKTGFCYKNYVGGNTLGKVRCRPAVFATNSTDPKQWFAKRWDGDVWAIDTSLIPDVVWYEDTHWFPDGQNKHIVTFDKIPPHALTLIQKGTE